MKDPKNNKQIFAYYRFLATYILVIKQAVWFEMVFDLSHYLKALLSYNELKIHMNFDKHPSLTFLMPL